MSDDKETTIAGGEEKSTTGNTDEVSPKGSEEKTKQKETVPDSEEQKPATEKAEIAEQADAKGTTKDDQPSTQDGAQKETTDGKGEAAETTAAEKTVGPDQDKAVKSVGGPVVRDQRSRGRDDRSIEKYWVPKTKLGLQVRDGKFTTMDQVLNSGLVLREPEIVDILLGEMQDEVIDVNMVQRMTDSGRRVRFAVTVAVGNENGYLGVGRAHGKEVGPTIRKAIDNAKTNIISLKRGCGSWECGCGAPHSIPFKTIGKSGSVVVTFLPAPKGVGLAVGDVAKKILKLGGVRDLWATTKGQTQTTWNYASAVFFALTNLSAMRINERQQEKFKILSGGSEE